MSLLKVDSLVKSFKGLRVINNVSLEVQRGERHAIIGPNGAGKTTLFNCITGSLSSDAGMITIDEKKLNKLPAHTRVSLGMSRTFQRNNLFDKLTVEENIHLALTSCKSYRFRIWKPLLGHEDLLQDTEELLKQWDFWDHRKRQVDELSYGEQRLLEIMLALASRPSILLLDEPTSGMSPAETTQTTSLIQDMPRSISLLVVEHDMEVVFSIADRITVLHHGEVLLSGPPEEVRGDERVKEVYFGGGAKPHA